MEDVKAAEYNSYKNQQENQNSLKKQMLMMLYYTIFILIIFLILQIRTKLQSLFSIIMRNMLYHIIKDTAIIIFMCFGIQFLNAFELLPQNTKVDSDMLAIHLAVFSLCWLLLGVYNVFISQLFINYWWELEKNLFNRKKIKSEYDNLQCQFEIEKSKLNSQQLSKRKELQRTLEYFLMRQEFISPSFLPIISENFLRDDFPFAKYMEQCMGKVTIKAFKLSFSSLFIFLVAIGLYIIQEYFIKLDIIQIYLVLSVPFIVTLILYIQLNKLKKIYVNLVHVVESQFDFEFAEFERNRQPFTNVEKINPPKYLNLHLKSAKHNLHQQLFWLNSPHFHTRILHLFLFIQIIWLIAFFAYYYSRKKFYTHFENQKFYNIILLIIAILLFLYNVLYLMPYTLYYLCITTNIQMMKDDKLITQVVCEQRGQNAKLFGKLYKLLKSQRTELGLDVDLVLREPILSQIEENFERSAKSTPKEDYRQMLQKVMHYSGYMNGKQDDEALRYFAHECFQNKDVELQVVDAKQACSKLAKDVTLDPSDCCKEILSRLLLNYQLQQQSKSGQKFLLKSEESDINIQDRNTITIKEFEIIITKLAEDVNPSFKVYINVLIHEIKYLTQANVLEIELDVLCNFIRNTIERYPR